MQEADWQKIVLGEYNQKIVSYISGYVGSDFVDKTLGNEVFETIECDSSCEEITRKWKNELLWALENGSLFLPGNMFS